LEPLSAALSHDAQVAAAGITTVFDALSLSDAPDKPQRKDALEPMLSGLKQAVEAGLTKSEHLLHLRCDVTNPVLMELLEPFLDEPLFRFMSLTDHTPGIRQYRDLDRFRAERTGRYNRSIEWLEAFITERQERSRSLGPGNKAKLSALAKERGLPLASHDDDCPEHVEEAIGLGAKVSEFPVTLKAAQACKELGLLCMAGAPNLVRGGSHCHNLSMAEAAGHGLVDIVSSDYIPMSLVQAVFALHQRHGYTLPDAVAAASALPAQAANLSDRGELAVGKRADLVQVSMHGAFPVIRAVWRGGKRIA
jgi:alpha-D-ribose 1-methylphosphonate 5-triphosphate diphosphatase